MGPGARPAVPLDFGAAAVEAVAPVAAREPEDGSFPPLRPVPMPTITIRKPSPTSIPFLTRWRRAGRRPGGGLRPRMEWPPDPGGTSCGGRYSRSRDG